MFEDYIWKYLFSNCSEKEKIYRDHRFFAGNTVVDFYLPTGCKSLGYPPKTAVEVKIFFNYPSISRIFQSYYPLYKHGVISKLIVFYKKISINESLNKFLASLKENFISIQEFSVLSSGNKKKRHTVPLLNEITGNPSIIGSFLFCYFTSFLPTIASKLSHRINCFCSSERSLSSTLPTIIRGSLKV